MRKTKVKKYDLKKIRNKLAGIFRSSKEFVDSASYWEERYRSGGGSGRGSYNELAEFKARIINKFIKEHAIGDVIEHGCGDGNQLGYMKYSSYLGFDISTEAIAICRNKFKSDPTKSFATNSEYAGEKAELSLSLDVIYHLVEDEVFESYMDRLFSSSNSYVIIYSSNFDDTPSGKQGHVRNRKFTDYVKRKLPDWEMIEHIPNEYPPSEDGKVGSSADFFIYRRKNQTN
ncbi:MAG: methyltransferase domain-containing protein [Deltaproteobacteria bacterium]|jgi:hypothetical protein|nr:methyltransferase domain-containing protein [Deltaproteobacteria bacterium]